MKYMKKLLSALLIAALCLALLAGCGKQNDNPNNDPNVTETPNTDAPQSPDDGPKSFKVAIVQQLDHASLDEIRMAIEEELEQLAGEKGFTISYDEYSGQNDASVLNQIGTQCMDKGYDMIIPIATLAATCMYNASEGKIPVVYAAASDPETSGLTGLENLTGTSDMLNTAFIMDMILAVQPEIKTVGLLYSKSELNSLTPIAQAKAYLDSKGIAYVEKTGNTADEVLAAANAMVGQVEAVFTPTDNTVMVVEAAVSDILNSNHIPHYTGADSFVTAGAFTTCGVNYTQLGHYTADMAVDILLGGEVPEYHVMEGAFITVNTETAETLGISYAPLADMAELIEVTTQAD